MLEVLSGGFKNATNRLRGVSEITEKNIKEAMEDVRTSLLEADVEYGVASQFLARVQEQVLGETVQLRAGKGEQKVKVSPADHFVKICHDELEKLMGPVSAELKWPANRPAIIMVVGLQGSGKTTTAAKLALYLRDQKKKKPMLVAADVYRPAAIEQLRLLGERIEIPVFSSAEKNVAKICESALESAYAQGSNAVILDTAGRLTVDKELMQELVNVKAKVNPDEILLVCDAMMGQDAVTTAKAFEETLSLTGVIMTKLDGDARGGAALSIKEVTGKPIKFLGLGEELGKLEEFRPQGLASRILGMGDIVGLMQDFEKVVDDDQEEMLAKMMRGQFSFDDFYKQVSMLQKLGAPGELAAKLPFQNLIPKNAKFDGQELVKIKTIIQSMTKQERQTPNVLNQSRLQRIASGSGRSMNDVNGLMQKFGQMRNMMNMLKGAGGMLGKIPGLGNLMQMGEMRKMAQAMAGGGGMPGGMGGMFPGMGRGAGAGSTKPKFDRDKQKKLRKLAKKAKKKNRK